MGKGGADDKVIAILCCCLIVGSPILGVGIWMIIEGDSGGVINVPVCCTRLASSTCVEYKSAARCGAWSESNRSLLEAVAVSSTVPDGILRDDNDYNINVQVPYGTSVAGSMSIASGSSQLVPTTSFQGATDVPGTEAYCEAWNDMETDLIARNYPAAQLLSVADEVDFAAFELPDGAVITTSVAITIEDPLGLLRPNALGGAVFAPQNGLSTMSGWGVAMTVIGGLIVLPPVCVIMAFLFSD